MQLLCLFLSFFLFSCSTKLQSFDGEGQGKTERERPRRATNECITYQSYYFEYIIIRDILWYQTQIRFQSRQMRITCPYICIYCHCYLCDLPSDDGIPKRQHSAIDYSINLIHLNCLGHENSNRATWLYCSWIHLGMKKKQ